MSKNSNSRYRSCLGCVTGMPFCSASCTRSARQLLVSAASSTPRVGHNVTIILRDLVIIGPSPKNDREATGSSLATCESMSELVVEAAEADAVVEGGDMEPELEGEERQAEKEEIITEGALSIRSRSKVARREGTTSIEETGAVGTSDMASGEVGAARSAGAERSFSRRALCGQCIRSVRNQDP